MNAIILAAGLSSRFAPLSYEKPKGLFVVKGEVLIERQIKQLHEAGITDITVVVGYKAEMFEYLKSQFGVSLVINEDYERYNNISSLIRVLEKLGNTYICSSDNYFPHNVFIGTPKESFYSALYAEGRTNEYCMTIGPDDTILDVKIGGENAWYMVGHVFFNKEFSKNIISILKEEYKVEKVRHGYWEDVYISHIDQLNMKVNRYSPGEIEEFDSIDDLRKFDPSYEELYQRLNKDSALSTLLQLQHKEHLFPIGELTKSEIVRLGGMSNKNFKVTYKGQSYVLRIPGNGSDGMVDRTNEETNATLASDLGISPAQYYFDSNSGIKVTAYLDDAEVMSGQTVQLLDNMNELVHIYKVLHRSNISMKNEFNIFHEIEKYNVLLTNAGGRMYEGWETYQPQIMSLKHRLKDIGYELVPCHNDAVPENFIKSKEGTLYLIDWEYSGMNAPLADIAALFLECNFSKTNQEYILSQYYDGNVPAVANEMILIFQILWDYLWSLWTVIKEAKGDDFGTYGKDRYNRAIRNLKYLNQNTYGK